MLSPTVGDVYLALDGTRLPIVFPLTTPDPARIPCKGRKVTNSSGLCTDAVDWGGIAAAAAASEETERRQQRNYRLLHTCSRGSYFWPGMVPPLKSHILLGTLVKTPRIQEEPKQS